MRLVSALRKAVPLGEDPQSRPRPGSGGQQTGASALRSGAFDWSALTTLRLRARTIADGLYAGSHPSARKGSGVEFGGHRPYVPGDDLRFLDRRALLRHDRLLLRQLQTETDRSLHLLLDASASMGFRGKTAPCTKFDYATALAAALARLALASSDPIALGFVGGAHAHPMPAMGGREAFERLLVALERARPQGDAFDDMSLLDPPLGVLAKRARRGSIVVFLSDLVDLHPQTLARLSALATGGRTLLTVRVLDSDEATLPYDGPVRLTALEGSFSVETDAESVRSAYLVSLHAQATEWSLRLQARGGRLIQATTSDDPISIVREIARAASQGTR